MLFAVDPHMLRHARGLKLANDSHDTMALPTTSASCEQATIRGSSPPDGDGSRSVSRPMGGTRTHGLKPSGEAVPIIVISGSREIPGKSGKLRAPRKLAAEDMTPLDKVIAGE
jgi:hypothetical protein